ncbi:MAG: RNA-binding protein [Candidatus Woesearchaeota archaeon]|nr:RNA-binding protein [Candidatus Woesearchaeota archaeon]
MLAHTIEIRVFCKPGEDPKKIYEKLLFFLPFDLYKQKIKVKKRNVTGFNEKQIIILSVLLSKKKLTKKVILNLVENLNNDQRKLIIRNADKQIDDDLDLYIRFDKNKLIKEDKLLITQKGNCFHIRLSLAVFPKKKHKAIQLVEKIFSKAL